jgi:hypothetical protein
MAIPQWSKILAEAIQRTGALSDVLGFKFVRQQIFN